MSLVLVTCVFKWRQAFVGIADACSHLRLLSAAVSRPPPSPLLSCSSHFIPRHSPPHGENKRSVAHGTQEAERVGEAGQVRRRATGASQSVAALQLRSAHARFLLFATARRVCRPCRCIDSDPRAQLAAHALRNESFGFSGRAFWVSPTAAPPRVSSPDPNCCSHLFFMSLSCTQTARGHIIGVRDQRHRQAAVALHRSPVSHTCPLLTAAAASLRLPDLP